MILFEACGHNEGHPSYAKLATSNLDRQ